MKKKVVKKKSVNKESNKKEKKDSKKFGSNEELKNLVEEHDIRKKKLKKKIIRKKITPRKLSPKREKEIAEDFSIKIYQKFNKMIKSIILFGSQAKNTAVSGSDIDLIIVVDDAAIKWDEELVSWYREELEKLVKQNKYDYELHLSTIRLTTWWEDLMRGDPTLINVIRYGEEIIDFGGFFRPLRFLLLNGKIRPTSEAIVSCIQR
ncbi:MAG: nucleotidyltransferase domain-containing protein, partial [Nanoarchaeota archaeon]